MSADRDLQNEIAVVSTNLTDYLSLKVEVRRAKEGETCPWCDEPGTSREGYSEWPIDIWMCGLCHRFMRQRRDITPSDDGEMCPSGNHLIADGGCVECVIGWETS